MKTDPKAFPRLPQVRTAEGDTTEGALILEGGSFRGVYTAGVCDVLMEHGIHLQTVVGVSAGTLNGLNVVSRQIGRFARIAILHRDDTRYTGWRAFLTDRGVIGFRFILHTAEKIIPYDRTFLFDGTRRLVTVATDIESGEPVYAESGTCSDFFRMVKASASLAFASRIVRFEGKKLLDGGYTVSVPLDWADAHGYRKKVVILTQSIDSRKTAVGDKKKKLFARFYKRYPAFLKAVENVPERYNELRERMQHRADAGEIFVIAPQTELNVSKTEKDTKKLYALYLQGREDAERAIPALTEYLGKRHSGTF